VADYSFVVAVFGRERPKNNVPKMRRTGRRRR